MILGARVRCRGRDRKSEQKTMQGYHSLQNIQNLWTQETSSKRPKAGYLHEKNLRTSSDIIASKENVSDSTIAIAT